MKLAEALSLIVPMERFRPTLDRFEETFRNYWLEKMRKKFGFIESKANDDELIVDFINVLQSTGADMTNSFRLLSKLPSEVSSFVFSLSFFFF